MNSAASSTGQSRFAKKSFEVASCRKMINTAQKIVNKNVMAGRACCKPFTSCNSMKTFEVHGRSRLTVKRPNMARRSIGTLSRLDKNRRTSRDPEEAYTNPTTTKNIPVTIE